MPQKSNEPIKRISRDAVESLQGVDAENQRPQGERTGSLCPPVASMREGILDGSMLTCRWGQQKLTT